MSVHPNIITQLRPRHQEDPRIIGIVSGEHERLRPARCATYPAMTMKKSSRFHVSPR